MSKVLAKILGEEFVMIENNEMRTILLTGGGVTI